MKKSWMIIASCVMAVSLTTGSVYAGSANGKGAASGKTVSDETKVKVTVEAEANATVTGVTYGDHGHNGYKGLLNAIVNVKDKPAGAVLAELLLSKYDTKLTAEMKTELEAIVEKDDALSAVATYLEKNGSVTDAVYVQKEAVLADIKNINAYKKLGKLYDKMGKKGIKLYVNGEEPVSTTAPIIREGKTLVPFRAISEALNADVSWNKVERSVTVTRDGITVKLFIDSKTAYVDGKKLTLDVPAGIVKGSTVIPIRFVSEALDAAVIWEAETKSVVIIKQ